MKKFLVTFFTLVVLFAFCGVCSGNNFLESSLKGYEAKREALLNLKMQLIEAIEELKPIAVQEYNRAKAIIQIKDTKDLTKDEKIIVLNALALLERLEKFYCQLGLVEWKLKAIEDRITIIKEKLTKNRGA